jgi:hypothetical protein
VADLFRVLGYRVTLRQTLAAREIDIVCERTDLPIPVTYIVECKSGKVVVSDVDAFHSKLYAVRREDPAHAASVPVLVHQGQIVGHALEHAHNLGIKCYEFADLLRAVWPFDAYLQALDQIYVDSDLERYYVPLDGITEGGERVSLDKHLDAWLEDDERRYLALLGDYGTGKTWLCLRMAKRMADAFRADPSRAPVPLLISFRRYQAGADLEALIKAELGQGYNVDMARPGALVKLLGSGRAVLILDGMDEMARKLGERSALLGYYNLGLPTHGPKVLVTCRTHFFYSGDEQREVLNPDADLLHLEDVPSFEIVHISLFDDKKVSRYVGQRFEARERRETLQMITDPNITI